MNKILFVDVETTGTDPKLHGLLQLSGAISINGTVKASRVFDFHLRPFPDDQIEDEALAIQGLTREDLANPARLDPRQVHGEFRAMLSSVVDKYNRRDKLFLVGYNATFDDNFLRAFFLKCEDKYYGSWICWPPIDVAVLAAAKLGRKRLDLVNFKLATVAKEIGIDVEADALHDSMYDVKLTKRLFDWCMNENHSDQP